MRLNKPLSVAFLLLICYGITRGQVTFYTSNGTDILRIRLPSVVDSVFHQAGGRIVGMAFDASRDILFWSDVSWEYRGIYKASISQSDTSLQNVEHIISTDISDINGLTLDTSTPRIYWTDSMKRSIETADYDGSKRLILPITGLFRPRGIYYHHETFKLYWNDQGTKKIEEANAAGQDRRVLVDEGVEWPNQMELYDGNLYWVDGFSKNLMTCSIATGDVRNVANFRAYTNDSSTFGLAISDGIGFVTSWSDTSLIRVGLRRGDVQDTVSSLTSEAMFSIVFNDPNARAPPANVCNGPSNRCESICFPTSTAAICACPSFGATVLSGRGCVDVREMVLYADADEGQVGFYSADTSVSNAFRYLVGRSVRPVAVAFDPNQHVVYWSDVHERTIHKAGLDGSDHTIFMSYNHSLGTVDGLAIEPRSRRLYYANMGTVEIQGASYSWHKIESVSLDDPNTDRRTIVSNVDKPRALTISGNYLYYTDWGTQARVVRVDLDGNNQEVISSRLDNPNGVAVINDLVIVTDSHHKSRQATSSIGSARNGSVNVFYENSGTWKRKEFPIQQQVPFGVTGFARNADAIKLYIGDWEKGILRSFITRSGTTILMTDLTRQLDVTTAMGLLHYNFADEPSPTPPVCESSGDTCSDNEVCLLDSNGQAECTCNSYDPLVQASDQCSLPSKFLLVSDMNSIKLLSLEGDDTSVYTIVQTGGYFSNIAALTYDPLTNNVYFADTNKQGIFKYNLVTYRLEVFFIQNSVVDGMTISDGHLYWSNTLQGTIEKINLSGSNETHRVIATGLSSPRGIQVVGSDVYWTEWGNPPRVARINQEGRVSVVLRDGIVWPNTVVVRQESGTTVLYVGDGKTRQITRCTLEDSSCSKITSEPDHIYNMVIKDRLIYYSDWVSSSVMVTDLDGVVQGTVLENLMRPTQMFIQYEQNVPSCPSGHGCSHSCLSTLKSFICYCRRGFYLASDQRTCIESQSPWVTAQSMECESSCSSSEVCAHLVSTNTHDCQCTAGRGGTQCQACALNMYKAVVGHGECTACPSGSTTSITGATECTCSDGQMWDWKTQTCVARGTPKPGNCPQSSQTVPERECSDDSDCENAQKCCENTCVDPVGLDECIYEGRVYYPGERFNPLCAQCECQVSNTLGDEQYGGAVCQQTQCMPLNCSVEQQVRVSDSCCPVCSETDTPAQVWFTNCPSDPVTVYTERGRDYAVYEFVPLYTNTLDHGVTATMSPAGNTFGWNGNSPHTINVVLSSEEQSNIDTCSIQLYVKDSEPPEITCPATQLYSTDQETYNVILPSPIFSDNVGISEIPTAPERPYPAGTYSHTYSVTDSADLTSSCTVNFSVVFEQRRVECGLAPQIDNGHYDCSGSNCQLKCHGGYKMGPGAPPESSISCSNGEWVPLKTGTITKSLTCVAVQPFIIRDRLHIQLPCKQGSNPLYTKSKVYDQLTSYLSRANSAFKTEVEVTGCDATGSENLNIRVTLSAEQTNSTMIDALTQQMGTLLEQITSDINDGSLSIKVESDNGVEEVAPTMLHITQENVETSTCQIGHAKTDDGCYLCTSGTYERDLVCYECQPSTYQDMYGQQSCKPCPSGMTSGKGAYKSDQCVVAESEQTPAGSNNLLYIIIGAVAAVVVIIIIVIVAVCIAKNKKNAYKFQNDEEEESYQTIPADDVGANPYLNLDRLSKNPQSTNAYEGIGAEGGVGFSGNGKKAGMFDEPGEYDDIANFKSSC